MTKLLSVSARPHVFPLDMAHCALLVIDVQNDFCHPEGFCLGDMNATPETVERVRAIIPRLAKLVSWARSQSMQIVFTKEAHKPDLSDAPPAKVLRYENAGYPIGSMGRRGRYLIRGEWGSQIVDELVMQPGDIVFDKPGQSIFVGTDVDAMLTERGITHLLVTGVTTECCVLATYRTASDLGYYPLLLEDCCAAYEPWEHEAAINVLLGENGAVGWVGDSEALMAAAL